ncbi:ribosomal protein L7/L12 C-terminal domain-containing protein [Flagelloscypha sp. PMI_526]|nr:ribosomal protein L7/L12 C-terminal domain-containing protein [Flagelloscypha sp. PMI_526]
MSGISCSSAFRLAARRTVLSQRLRQPQMTRQLATAVEASSNSAPSPPPSSTDAKINKIVDEISGLSLLQAADLITALKTRLNIQEIAMPSAAPAAAAPAAASADEEAAEEPKEKTIFSLKLESFDAGSKPKIIREVKNLNTSLTLIEAKKLVDAVPKVLKENLPKDEADALKKKFEELGAVVVLE